MLVCFCFVLSCGRKETKIEKNLSNRTRCHLDVPSARGNNSVSQACRTQNVTRTNPPLHDDFRNALLLETLVEAAVECGRQIEPDVYAHTDVRCVQLERARPKRVVYTRDTTGEGRNSADCGFEESACLELLRLEEI